MRFVLCSTRSGHHLLNNNNNNNSNNNNNNNNNNNSYIVPTDEGQSGPKRLAKFALYPAEWCCFDKRREGTDVLRINN